MPHHQHGYSKRQQAKHRQTENKITTSGLFMREEILKILAEAGPEGLRVRKIILHVYNSQNDLFNKVSLEEVKRRVLLFLQQNSRYSQDLLDHPSWGTYRLNPKSIKAQTTQLSFLPTEDDCPDVAQQKPAKQTGPTLFDNINS